MIFFNKRRKFSIRSGHFGSVGWKIAQSKMDKIQVRRNKKPKKFIVLEFNQNFMAFIGISSHQLTEPSNEFFRSIAAYFILFNLLGWCIVSSSVFVYQNIENLELALVTALIIVAGFQSGGMFLAVGLKMAAVKMVHLRLQEIVNAGE